MLRWHGSQQAPSGRSVVTVGVFDGVHRGHRHLVEHAARRACELGLPLVAVVVDPPSDADAPAGARRGRLTGDRRRVRLLGELGADAVATLPCTARSSRQAPGDVVRQVLAGELHAAVVVVGAGFRSGPQPHGAAVASHEPGESGEFGDVTVEEVPALTDDGIVVSATAIRVSLADGAVRDAARLLGRPHRVEGVVVRGHQRGGSALGFPTANVESPPRTAIPRDGVYAGWLRVGADRWPAAISVGVNSTFDAGERSVEAYALDRDDLDLYGAHAAVEFVARLRDMVRFDGVEPLIEQMRRDAAQARDITSRDA